MQFLVQVEIKLARDTAMLLVEAVANFLELARKLFQVGVILWLHHEVVILELVEVERVLDHRAVF